MTKNDETIATIIGSLRLEGLQVEAAVVADMHRIDRGELTTEQAIQNAIGRVWDEEIR
jgi:ADP-ribose diphosphatase